MRVDLTEQFQAQFEDAELSVQKAVVKQLRLLKQNIRHPSLHAKKFNEAEDIWQARVNKSWRFYFKIHDDTYRIIEMKTHPK
jgi:mRNA-degrading endonuclease RelE of RelBE toxin-antitoxin system